MKLNQKLNDLQQHSHRQNMEMHELAFTEKENIRGKVNTLAEKLERSILSKNDIKGLHRLLACLKKVPVYVGKILSVIAQGSWASTV